MKTLIQLSILTTTLLFIACKQKSNSATTAMKTVDVITWQKAQTYYIQHMDKAINYLDNLKQAGVNGTKSKYYFAKAREAFKIAEPFASYLNPEVGHRTNGPALPVYKEDTGKILYPIGLQKIEESVYEQDITDKDFNQEIKITQGLMLVLKGDMTKRQLTPQRFFRATHQQLFRLISLDISGFDTPVSHLGIKETATSLNSLYKVYEFTLQPSIIKKDALLDQQFKNSIENAVKYVENNTNFDTFDRFTFTRDYLNPITTQWVNIRKTADIWEPTTTDPFNFDAPTFFENNSFNLNHFTAVNNRNPSKAQIDLGKKLFFDPNLSANHNMVLFSTYFTAFSILFLNC